ncbi:MAG: two-component system, OmpR family, response regulator [Acidimicrobiaceae bacterium]|jgi:DNA-binding response OmpR family regulator|nr:two-component system, OmpR family, response regulator [Acidimicrobiaceae bacterium]MDQ1368249.1 two-component system, OmpR family, response regulator [Acidimicrobiaceae bacterium]MDQ1399719.1 two-component system, OmpR family, response regulator [Acidimicrobiaceae bacterium]MDQ1417005.1 two-component system, OmpR family, response regulator [Acidimicrobiaceae bacterium]MDQ1419096.1 two-component system, OmpR family, response regulator [Acidimicrobiaceae bacterium]
MMPTPIVDARLPRSPTELRVLVVEDDRSARDLLVEILENDGYQVLAVADGLAALDAAAAFQPDLALIDGCLPGGHGLEVAHGLRRAGNVPIIFVTGADSAQDIHAGFKMGADDYIVKPFDPEELSWRVQAVLRRAGHPVSQIWECGDLVVDEGARSVTRAGVPIDLTATEFKILGVLIRKRTQVVVAGQLLGQVWGYDADHHLLEVHVSSLRRKLEVHGSRMIQTVRSTGYVLRP